jgi:NADH:ubiquinone oxidoreductase subunit F (NADH-binding)/NADH:ubiquinone oxidoreductase subunit E
MGELIDALFALQADKGFLDDERLRDLAVRLNVPLYRLQELVSFYPHFRSTRPSPIRLSVCRDVACRMACDDAHRAKLRGVADSNGDVEWHDASCLGRCEIAPAAAINDSALSVRNAEALAGWLDSPPAPYTSWRSARRWQCDPYDSEAGRYGTLRTKLAAGFDPDAIVQELKDSGLRGMGGAGFPTGVKWGMVRNQPGGEKYVVCNADESEPGTFKDRMVLSELPHLIIEGMVLAGLVIGAERGIVFIRHEYGPERDRLAAAIADARTQGVLGNDVLYSGRPFDIDIAVSPGGYILGEETALLECLEDRRGEPRNKPPFPGSVGLFGKPTLINNVETFAFVPLIVKAGATAWKARGTRGCGGLKLIALSGDVVFPGVYEVPMGTTIAELIDMGGGVVGGGAPYAIAPGSASSNFIRGDKIDLPLDFDALQKAGTMLGSGAVLVIKEGRDLLDLATNVVTFFRNESCGKCVPCRVGSEKAVNMLERAVAGQGSKRQLALMNELRDTMEQTSICGLGQVALNPFTSMLEAFDDEIRKQFSRD